MIVSLLNSLWTASSGFGRTNAPGQQECDAVMEKLKDQVTVVDQALVGAVSHTLKPSKDASLEVGVCQRCVAFATHFLQSFSHFVTLCPSCL